MIRDRRVSLSDYWDSASEFLGYRWKQPTFILPGPIAVEFNNGIEYRVGRVRLHDSGLFSIRFIVSGRTKEFWVGGDLPVRVLSPPKYPEITGHVPSGVDILQGLGYPVEPPQ
jgi:hypothetical protein